MTGIQRPETRLLAVPTTNWGRVANVLSPKAYVISLAQSACMATLKRTTVGYFEITLRNGEVRKFGDKDDQKMRASVKILDDNFWLRIALFSAMGFGEAYMYHEIEVINLATLLIILTLNRDRYSEMNLLPAGLNTVLNSVLHSRIPNTIMNALRNIQAHYDLGNEMFSCFLDPSLMYSCPIWAEGREGEVEELESAQMRKVHRMLDLADIREGDRVLEIGTGWGTLAIEAVKRHPTIKVTTLTLSIEQKNLAEGRIAAAGLSDSITVLLCDYRSHSPPQPYDRIISIEMLEAVGPEFLSTFFRHCHSLLHPTRGILALQVITMPDSRYEQYKKKTDFIQRYIFPGGHCPSVSALTEAVYRGSGGELILDELNNIGPHYAKALRLWREAFSENCARVAKEHGLEGKYDDVFRRKWEFYFAYCEAGFATRTLGNVQVRLTRCGNRDLLAGIPM